MANQQLDLDTYVEMNTYIREEARPDFIRKGRAVEYTDHEVLIAVKQLNIDVLEAEALNRNTPGHRNYRQWLSYNELGAIRDNIEGSQAIEDWLSANNVEVTWSGVNKMYMRATTTIGHWENLLMTTFHLYEDQKDGYGHRQLARAERYSLPASIREHVHAFFEVSELPARITYHGAVRDRHQKDSVGIEREVVALVPAESQNQQLRAHARRLSSTCAGQSTIQCLNSVYDVGSNIGCINATQAVFETSTESFSPEDLTQFQEDYDCTIQAALDVGGYNETTCNTQDDTDSCYEGNLDIQYIMGIAQLTVSTYYHVPGDTDPFTAFVQDLANMTDPYMVNSISWGGPEMDYPASNLDIFNNEAMALAARGVTIMVSSGDNGANGMSDCTCNENSGSDSLDYPTAGDETWSGKGYFPSFPATSPYVTAVGATMGPNFNDPVIACQSQEGGVITSGGGFSTYYEAPSWQTEAIANYFNQAAADGTTPPEGYSPKGRGYPDVAMLGTNFPVIINGLTYEMCGTSASSPLFASFVSLLNSVRMSDNSAITEGLGWLNPMLWSAGNNVTFSGSDNVIFTDVISGDNMCCEGQNPHTVTCCESGYTTTTGWDPLTGWGEITYTNFASLYGYSVDGYTASGSGSNSGDKLSTTGTALISVFCILAVIFGLMWLCGCARPNKSTTDSYKEQQLSSASRQEAGAEVGAAYVPPTVVRNNNTTTKTDNPMWT